VCVCVRVRACVRACVCVCVYTSIDYSWSRQRAFRSICTVLVRNK